MFNSFYQTIINNADTAKIIHYDSEKFLESIISNNHNQMIEYLIKFNTGALEEKIPRTIVLMDATGSMYDLIEKTKQTIHTMFVRASTILKQNGLKEDCFQLQFAAFRNYNSKAHEILQVSPWTSKPNDLKKFLNGVKATGGWSNEAVEVGLWHALEEHKKEPISQVILIGDANPNTKVDIQKKRQGGFGDAYWNATQYKEVAYYEDYLPQFVDQGIPINAFYVDQIARDSFRDIAKVTSGSNAALDIYSLSGADVLTNLVTVEILRNIGKQKGLGDKLVDSYKKQYKGSD